MTFLPLRTIIFVSFIYKYLCGLRWQRKRVINNTEVCRLELLNFLEEKQLSSVIIDFSQKWDVQVRKTMSIETLEDRITNHFQKVVRIYLPKHILTLCETPEHLIEYVGHTNFMIPLPKCDRNENPAITNPRIKKRSIPMHYHLHNFIMSRVPSDIYKIRNPSINVEKDSKSGILNVTQKRSARLETTSDSTMSFIKHSFPEKQKEITRQHIGSADLQTHV